MKLAMYEHQKEAFERFKDATNFALLMDMGLGKTKLELDIVCHRFRQERVNRLLVVAPNGVHEQWAVQQIPEHVDVPYKVFTWNSSLAGRKYYKRQMGAAIHAPFTLDHLKIVCVNIEAFQSTSVLPFIKEFVQYMTMVACDESTSIKNPKAKRSRNLIAYTRDAESRQIMTGTPAAKSPIDFWNQMFFLDSEANDGRGFFGCNYYAFQHRYALMMRQHAGPGQQAFERLIDENTFEKIVKNLDKISDDIVLAHRYGVSEKTVAHIRENRAFHQFRDLDEIKAKIAPISAFARKEDCLDLPPKIYQTIEVEMTKEQRKVYKDLQAKLMAEYADKELNVANRAALMTRLMQVIGGYMPYYEEGAEKPSHIQIGVKNIKINALLELMDNFAGEPLLIWARFARQLEGIYAAVRKVENRTELYYGQTPKLNRPDIVKRFEGGDTRVFVANPAMAGSGFNFQHCHNQVFMGNSFVVKDRLQAEDRSHRSGVTAACTYVDILMKDSIDMLIKKVIKTGRDVNDYFKGKSLGEIVFAGEDMQI